MAATNIIRIMALSLLAPGLFACCIWDRDTLANEAKGLDAVADAISGKVERYPPRFYEMRLERISELLKSTPFDLGLYDDCAAALDRLGRYDEALTFLDRKREAMERFAAGEGPPSSRYREERYFNEQVRRRLINEASTRLHRWVKAGGPRENMSDVAQARTLIVEARKLDSSFPAERYLQFVAEWLMAGATAEPDSLLPDALGLRYKNKTARGPNEELKVAGLDDCLDGLAGLIRSSEVWECVDVFYWLSLALAVDGRQSLAYMARLRAYEIIDAGGGSLVPNAPTAAKLKDALVPRIYEAGRKIEAKSLSDAARAEVEEEFGRRRRFAQRWREAQWEFMAGKFEFGAHPDIDLRFWAGFEAPTMLKRDLPSAEPAPPGPKPEPPKSETAPPVLKPAPDNGEDPSNARTLMTFVSVGAATVLLVSLGLWALTRRRNAA